MKNNIKEIDNILSEQYTHIDLENEDYIDIHRRALDAILEYLKHKENGE